MEIIKKMEKLFEDAEIELEEELKRKDEDSRVKWKLMETFVKLDLYEFERLLGG